MRVKPAHHLFQDLTPCIFFISPPVPAVATSDHQTHLEMTLEIPSLILSRLKPSFHPQNCSQLGGMPAKLPLQAMPSRGGGKPQALEKRTSPDPSTKGTKPSVLCTSRGAAIPLPKACGTSWAPRSPITVKNQKGLSLNSRNSSLLGGEIKVLDTVGGRLRPSGRAVAPGARC